MVGRALLLFLAAVIITAFFVPAVHSHELPCLPKNAAATFEPPENLRGYGTTDEGLVKLSVSSSGAWMLTFSPLKMDGAVCIFWLGENWQFVAAGSRRAERDD